MFNIDELGEFNPADENVLDVQSIADAAMSTGQSLAELAIRFGLNILVCWIIVQFFYFTKSRRRDYYFTFMVFSSAMLLLLYMMGNVEVGVGLTLGLFAIFGVIRYRTETVPIREMTYLFAIIAISAVNGLAPVFKLAGAVSTSPHYELAQGGLAVLVIANLLMIILIWVLEDTRVLKAEATRLILYDKIELIVPDRRTELTADIEKRLGIKVDKLEVGYTDFLKDAAYIKVYYTLAKGESDTIGHLTNFKDFT